MKEIVEAAPGRRVVRGLVDVEQVADLDGGDEPLAFLRGRKQDVLAILHHHRKPQPGRGIVHDGSVNDLLAILVHVEACLVTEHTGGPGAPGVPIPVHSPGRLTQAFLHDVLGQLRKTRHQARLLQQIALPQNGPVIEGDENIAALQWG